MSEVKVAAMAQADDRMRVQPSCTLDEKHLSKPSMELVTVEVAVDDVPPDGGYGWVCVACCFTVNAMTWGVNTVRGFFLELR